MNEAKKIKEETTEVGLTTATLAGAGDQRCEVLLRQASALAALHLWEPRPFRLLTSRRRRSFHMRKRKIFAHGGMLSKLVLLTSRGRQYSRQIVSLQER